MSEPVSSRRSATRERIIAAAVAVMAEKGVLGASVEEICEAAGFTRGAFYSNFADKNDLCLAILDAQASARLRATHAAIASVEGLEPDADRGLDHIAQQAIRLFLQAQLEDRASLLAFTELRLYAIRTPSLRDDYLQFMERVSGEFLVLVEQTAHRFGCSLGVDGPLALSMLQGVYDQTALDALLTGRPIDSPERARALGAVLQSILVPLR